MLSEIRVIENGVGLLELIDNGSGICPDNFENLCKLKKKLNFFTKLKSFSITRLHIFNF